VSDEADSAMGVVVPSTNKATNTRMNSLASLVYSCRIRLAYRKTGGWPSTSAHSVLEQWHELELCDVYQALVRKFQRGDNGQRKERQSHEGIV